MKYERRKGDVYAVAGKISSEAVDLFTTSGSKYLSSYAIDPRRNMSLFPVLTATAAGHEDANSLLTVRQRELLDAQSVPHSAGENQEAPTLLFVPAILPLPLGSMDLVGSRDAVVKKIPKPATLWEEVSSSSTGCSAAMTLHVIAKQCPGRCKISSVTTGGPAGICQAKWILDRPRVGKLWETGQVLSHLVGAFLGLCRLRRQSAGRPLSPCSRQAGGVGT